ncbi:MAG: FtsX-like permease family protein [Saprospiraceae bacterium]|nr:FtsX-like permease family protein [Saprospiraceae bacterium]
MLTNYLKITWAVLKRRKLFTFISLFGISLTLTVLIVVVAFLDHLFAPNYPELQRKQLLYIERVELKDTTQLGSNTSSVGYYFIKEYISKLKTPEKIAFCTSPRTINGYSPTGNKIRLLQKYTDANFWEVTDFNFLEGRPYTQNDIDRQASVVVINEQIRDDYFGKGQQVTGKTFEIDNIKYQVIGVVKGSPITRFYTSSDIYIPYNLTKDDLKSTELNGPYIVILRGTDPQNLLEIRAEFAALVPKIPLPPGGTWFKPGILYAHAESYLEGISRQLFTDGTESGLKYFYIVIFSFMALFMTLPAINLVNINMNRIMERASEIGIRKAFGASSTTLTWQFIIENVILSLMGTLIAVVLSVGVIYYINHCGLIPNADLLVNWTVLGWAVVLSIVFGLFSGVYPAWRMSKLQVVQALNGGE